VVGGIGSLGAVDDIDLLGRMDDIEVEEVVGDCMRYWLEDELVEVEQGMVEGLWWYHLPMVLHPSWEQSDVGSKPEISYLVLSP
jgi:hypothetical protein